jgi:predicted unusual protein kinase regulating ubiquinone biosynthesis (AarF/ABC1/UbiB family)
LVNDLKQQAGEPAHLGSVLFSGPNARRLAARLGRLRGAAMKVGQLVSLQGEDVLPPEFAQALAVLRAQATPMPLQQLRGVLGREFGKGWERRFATFDYEPVAAASIGQVHHATTPDGRDLALKIQYPGVARSITSDIDNVAVLRLFNLLPLNLDVAASLPGQAPARPGSRFTARALLGAMLGWSQRAAPRRPARALGPDDVPGHGHGFRGG